MQKIQSNLNDFIKFIREQGVVGLAVGIILGGSVKEVVTALISDFISPIVGLFMGAAGNLKEASFSIGSVTFMWGHFLATLIDFIVVAAVVYFVISKLAKKLDKPKE
jgi:large conductance mechanosensitive channel